MTVIGALRTQDNAAQRNTTEDQTPIVDYETPVPALPEERLKRQRRGKHYDNSHLVVEPQKPAGRIIATDHTIGKIPALPVNLSDAIVIGNITDAKAYLSSDKSGVYTEFTVQLEEILKNTTPSLKIGSPFSAQRVGGRVRFPSGIVQRYGVSSLGMPRHNGRYALFLKRIVDSDAFMIVTAYELRAGEVYPLDGVNVPKGASELPQFALYKGMDETEFLTRLRTAI
jgi:hypothetical protein